MKRPIFFMTRLMEKHEFEKRVGAFCWSEGLRGDELFYIILTDGKNFIPMAPARDPRAYGL